jgi:formylglycine-generating enzyme required for sulfatase activity
LIVVDRLSALLALHCCSGRRDRPRSASAARRKILEDFPHLFPGFSSVPSESSARAAGLSGSSESEPVLAANSVWPPETADKTTTINEKFNIMKTRSEEPRYSRPMHCLETESWPLGQASWLAVLCCALWAVAPQASAQTSAGLDLQLYAGLSITGAVGTVYSIEYVTELAQTNDATAWRCLEFLQLPASPYLWADKSAPVTGKRFFRAVVFAAPTNLVFIPPGTFRMGSPTNEVDREDYWEDPQTAVTISRGFWMGKYLVTQGEYQTLMGSNPSWFNGDRTADGGSNYGANLTRPAESLSWFDATNYCGQLTQQERAAGRIATNSVYRLPTEAEWEYACRAWTSTRFSYGDDPGYTNLTDYAWYGDNSGGMTHPVGQKLPNCWGLYDMHGNVLEHCQDWYGHYPGGSIIDPQGPATGAERVSRGGCRSFTAGGCRSALRAVVLPGFWSQDLGFRVMLAPGQP